MTKRENRSDVWESTLPRHTGSFPMKYSTDVPIGTPMGSLHARNNLTSGQAKWKCFSFFILGLNSQLTFIQKIEK